MLNTLRLLHLFSLWAIAQQGICLDSGKYPTCQNSSNDKLYRLFVEHGQPLTMNGHRGMVLINSTLVHIGHVISSDRYTPCTWTFEVGQQKRIAVKECSDGSVNRYAGTWHFLKPGFTQVQVTVSLGSFDNNRQGLNLRNCTFVNVKDCSRQISLAVSTSKGSFNVSNNHRKVFLDSPGLVNFSVNDIIDPFYICHPFYYNWSFGDSQGNLKLSRKTEANHFYNSTGMFHMVLSVFNRKHENKFYENVSIIIQVKGIPSTGGISNTAIKITLGLAICFVSLLLAVYLVMIFRKRLQRSTEIASFDFRDEDCQSVNTDIYYGQSCCGKLTCNGDREWNRLLTVDNYESTSHVSFGSI